jgi:iron complex outermembrane receptor protein
MRTTRATGIAGILLWLALGLTVPSGAAEAVSAPPVDLTGLSLEELLNVEVTLVSRRPERLAQTTAAIAVLSAEDLRRCAVRSLPEALRLVPGMQVARIDANKWAVTSRGFASTMNSPR